MNTVIEENKDDYKLSELWISIFEYLFQKGAHGPLEGIQVDIILMGVPTSLFPEIDFATTKRSNNSIIVPPAFQSAAEAIRTTFSILFGFPRVTDVRIRINGTDEEVWCYVNDQVFTFIGTMNDTESDARDTAESLMELLEYIAMDCSKISSRLFSVRITGSETAQRTITKYSKSYWREILCDIFGEFFEAFCGIPRNRISIQCPHGTL